jgi:hypothetical protein
MARFFEQKLNFSLFYQNLIEKRFYKNGSGRLKLEENAQGE